MITNGTELVWRKASRSAGNGGACVEVAAKLPWRKATRSAGNGGQCVEVAGFTQQIAMRDSKLPTEGEFPYLAVPVDNWLGLLATIKHGDLDPLDTPTSSPAPTPTA